MKEISIADIAGYELPALRKFIKESNEKFFLVTIPRWKKADSEFDECPEYEWAAYMGNCLAKAAKKFRYNVPMPGSGEEFFFVLEIEDEDKFADALIDAREGVDTDIPTMDFEDEVLLYNQGCIKGTIEGHTKGLVMTGQTLHAEMLRRMRERIGASKV